MLADDAARWEGEEVVVTAQKSTLAGLVSSFVALLECHQTCWGLKSIAISLHTITMELQSTTVQYN